MNPGDDDEWGMSNMRQSCDRSTYLCHSTTLRYHESIMTRIIEHFSCFSTQFDVALWKQKMNNTAEWTSIVHAVMHDTFGTVFDEVKHWFDEDPYQEIFRHLVFRLPKDARRGEQETVMKELLSEHAAPMVDDFKTVKKNEKNAAKKEKKGKGKGPSNASNEAAPSGTAQPAQQSGDPGSSNRPSKRTSPQGDGPATGAAPQGASSDVQPHQTFIAHAEWHEKHDNKAGSASGSATYAFTAPVAAAPPQGGGRTLSVQLHEKMREIAFEDPDSLVEVNDPPRAPPTDTIVHDPHDADMRDAGVTAWDADKTAQQVWWQTHGWDVDTGAGTHIAPRAAWDSGRDDRSWYEAPGWQDHAEYSMEQGRWSEDTTETRAPTQGIRGRRHEGWGAPYSTWQEPEWSPECADAQWHGENEPQQTSYNAWRHSGYSSTRPRDARRAWGQAWR